MQGSILDFGATQVLLWELMVEHMDMDHTAYAYITKG